MIINRSMFCKDIKFENIELIITVKMITLSRISNLFAKKTTILVSISVSGTTHRANLFHGQSEVPC